MPPSVFNCFNVSLPWPFHLSLSASHKNVATPQSASKILSSPRRAGRPICNRRMGQQSRWRGHTCRPRLFEATHDVKSPGFRSGTASTPFLGTKDIYNHGGASGLGTHVIIQTGTLRATLRQSQATLWKSAGPLDGSPITGRQRFTLQINSQTAAVCQHPTAWWIIKTVIYGFWLANYTSDFRVDWDQTEPLTPCVWNWSPPNPSPRHLSPPRSPFWLWPSSAAVDLTKPAISQPHIAEKQCVALQSFCTFALNPRRQTSHFMILVRPKPSRSSNCSW